MKKLILLFFIISTYSCRSIKGKYCYNTVSISECITFKKNKEFQYDYWIDTGSDKGVGTYDIDNNKLILNFIFPELENKSQIKITKNKDDFIKIRCVDFEGNLVSGGLEIRKENGFYKGYSLMGQPTELKVSWIEFPATFTLDCLPYQKTSFELLEPSGYDIDITLDDNHGFTKNLNGQRSYDIVSKNKKQLVLESVTDSSGSIIKIRRVYKKAE